MDMGRLVELIEEDYGHMEFYPLKGDDEYLSPSYEEMFDAGGILKDLMENNEVLFTI